jgi:hypothetical protein
MVAVAGPVAMPSTVPAQPAIRDQPIVPGESSSPDQSIVSEEPDFQAKQ